MFAINLSRFCGTPLQRDPFDYVIVANVLKREILSSVQNDFPRINDPGSYPLSELRYGATFGALIKELRGRRMREAFEDKFSLNLEPYPTVVTVRGHCGPNDGRIHTDLPGKVLTVLLYLNPSWQSTGGRLRLLRSATDLNEVAAEVPPLEGTLLAFRRCDHSWHGHQPFTGPRRVIQVNWVTRRHLWALRREELSSRVLRWAKKWLPQSA